MIPIHKPAAAASSKTTSITPSQLRLLAQREHEEWLLDEALRETFPASDPIAVTLMTGPWVIGRSPSLIDLPQEV
jgi:hypothetical protein